MADRAEDAKKLEKIDDSLFADTELTSEDMEVVSGGTIAVHETGAVDLDFSKDAPAI